MSLVEQDVDVPTEPDFAPRAAVAVHYVSLAIAFLGLLTLAVRRDQWFSSDEWYAITGWLMASGPKYSYLLPFNNHLSIAPLLLLRGMFSVFGLRTYTPYLAMLLAFHLGVAHLLWRVCRSAGVSLWIATGLVVAFLVNGGGAQNFFFAWMIVFLGALVFGLATILLVNREHADRRLDIAAAVTAIVSLAFSGVGLSLVATAGIVVLLRRGYRQALGFMAAPTVAYLIWFVAYGRRDGGGQYPAPTPIRPRELTRMPALVWRGLVVSFETSTIFVGGGTVLIVALAVWLYTHRDRARTSAAPAFAMCAGAVLFYLSVGVTRVQFGVAQADKSRYTYVGWCLLLPAVALALDSFIRSPRARMVVALALAAVLSLNGLDTTITEANFERSREVALKHAVLASAVIVSTEPVLPGVVVRRAPGNLESGSLTTELLADLEDGGYLPALPRLTETARLDAALPLQVSVSSSPVYEVDRPNAPVVGTVSGATTDVDADGCVAVTPTSRSAPTIAVRLDKPASIQIVPSAAGLLRVALHSDDTNATSTTLTSHIGPDHDAYVNLAATTSTPVITLPRNAATTVCGMHDATT